jgi:hypothetical protein
LAASIPLRSTSRAVIQQGSWYQTLFKVLLHAIAAGDGIVGSPLGQIDHVDEEGENQSVSHAAAIADTAPTTNAPDMM